MHLYGSFHIWGCVCVCVCVYIYVEWRWEKGCYTLQSLVFTATTAKFNAINSVFCQYNLFTCSAWVSQYTSTTALCNIHRMVYLMEAHAVPSNVWAESLHTVWINFSLQRVKLNAFVLHSETDQASDGCRTETEIWTNLINIPPEKGWRVLNVLKNNYGNKVSNTVNKISIYYFLVFGTFL